METPRKLVLQPSSLEKQASLRVCPEQSRRVQRKSSSAAPCGHSQRRIAIALAVLLGAIAMIVSSSETLFAQTPTASPTPAAAPPAEPDGVTRGGYQIHSSVELGYRSNDVTGSGDMYDTLVDLQSGPRILDQTLTMQSVDHQGLLFDDLYLNSFGWGGDPNNALRLRADKNKWYNLQGSFRRDQYFSDYDLWANPLNPPPPPAPGGSTPSIPILDSPHLFATTRRLSDVDLTLLPQSTVSFRLGYSHNNMTGPSYSSIHEGTEASLLQDWNTTMNSYRMGVDFRIAPRTVLSYDQFLDYYKGDTDYQLNPLNEALLPAVPVSSVSLGLSFDTVNKEPCAVPAGQPSLIVNGTLTNVTCNAYSSYSRNQRVRTSTPTERISLRSNYFRKLEVLGSFSYSSAVSSTPLDESFSGLITRTNTLAFTGTGTAAANRISDVADLGATLHLTQHLRLIEKFYFWAYRIPQNGNLNELDYTCAAPPCTLLSTPLTTPGSDANLNPVVLQPDLDEKSDRTGLGHFEKGRGSHRVSLRRPGLQPLQRFSARRSGPFRGPGKNGALRGLGTSHPCLAIEFRSGAHKLQRRVRPPVSAQGRALSLPDDLHTALVGDPGRFHQYPARIQWRLTNPVRGTQPELRADRVAGAPRTLRPGSRVQLQQRNPECHHLLQ